MLPSPVLACPVAVSPQADVSHTSTQKSLQDKRTLAKEKLLATGLGEAAVVACFEQSGFFSYVSQLFSAFFSLPYILPYPSFGFFLPFSSPSWHPHKKEPLEALVPTLKTFHPKAKKFAYIIIPHWCFGGFCIALTVCSKQSRKCSEC